MEEPEEKEARTSSGGQEVVVVSELNAFIASLGANTADPYGSLLLSLGMLFTPQNPTNAAL